MLLTLHILHNPQMNVNIPDYGGDGSGGGTTPDPPGDYGPCDGGPVLVSSTGNSISVIEPTPCDAPDPNEPQPIAPGNIIVLQITKDPSITANPKINCILNKLEGGDSQGVNLKQTKYDDLLNAFRDGKVWNMTYKLEPIPNDPQGKIILGKRRGPETISSTNNFENIFNSNYTDICTEYYEDNYP